MQVGKIWHVTASENQKQTLTENEANSDTARSKMRINLNFSVTYKQMQRML